MSRKLYVLFFDRVTQTTDEIIIRVNGCVLLGIGSIKGARQSVHQCCLVGVAKEGYGEAGLESTCTHTSLDTTHAISLKTQTDAGHMQTDGKQPGYRKLITNNAWVGAHAMTRGPECVVAPTLQTVRNVYYDGILDRFYVLPTSTSR